MRRRVGPGFVGLLVLAAVVSGYAWLGNRTSTRPQAPAPSPASAPADCVVDGDRSVTVPNLIGTPLPEAIAKARATGLHVVGTGTPTGDPVDASANVRAQKPPAGTRVPVGACLGFRTDT